MAASEIKTYNGIPIIKCEDSFTSIDSLYGEPLTLNNIDRAINAIPRFEDKVLILNKDQMNKLSELISDKGVTPSKKDTICSVYDTLFTGVFIFILISVINYAWFEWINQWV